MQMLVLHCITIENSKPELFTCRPDFITFSCHQTDIVTRESQWVPNRWHLRGHDDDNNPALPIPDTRIVSFNVLVQHGMATRRESINALVTPIQYS